MFRQLAGTCKQSAHSWRGKPSGLPPLKELDYSRRIPFRRLRSSECIEETNVPGHKDKAVSLPRGLYEAGKMGRVIQSSSEEQADPESCSASISL